MDFFNYRQGELFAEDVSLSLIAHQWKTPAYVYSKKTLLRHLEAFKKAFSSLKKVKFCYALKANANPEILKIIKSTGFGADCVSAGELYLAQKTGFSPEKIVFNGNGKKDSEIEYALKMKVGMINVDSIPELFSIARISKRLEVKPKISFRVNPEITVSTHPHIATGIENSKFGIPLKDALEAYLLARKLKIDARGIHCHIGSQITSPEPFVEALEKIYNFSKVLARKGIKLKVVNAGGGIGVRYKKEIPPVLEEFASKIIPVLRRIAPEVIFEPGRVIVANAAVFLMKVILVKKTDKRNFLVVDGGMNDILRPALYGAYHEIVPVKIFEERPKENFYVVGPVCESGDVLAKKRFFPVSFSGELLALRGAGAYGYSMSSNYNLRPRPAEILVSGKNATLIRRRETIEEISDV